MARTQKMRGQTRFRASYHHNSLKTVLAIALPMVRRFKFVCCVQSYKKKLVLYMPRLNSDGDLESVVSHFKNLKILKFQVMDLKFVSL